jgi:queuine tRNA-ribosyltransferase
MSLPNHFELLATDGAARTGRLTTPHGVIRTPAFMPVGTAGAMKGVHWREVREAGSDIVLGNTYHLMLRPGAERIAALGGLQRFTGWGGPMLTDSGGFQVMSLANLRKVDERAVTFRSHIDGAKVELSPERSTNACGCRPIPTTSSAPCCCRGAGRSGRSAPSRARRPATCCSASCRAAT